MDLMDKGGRNERKFAGIVLEGSLRVLIIIFNFCKEVCFRVKDILIYIIKLAGCGVLGWGVFTFTENQGTCPRIIAGLFFLGTVCFVLGPYHTGFRYLRVLTPTPAIVWKITGVLFWFIATVIFIYSLIQGSA